MTPPSPAPAPSLKHRLLIFTMLTVLFALLNWLGSALYHAADGLTTVKAFGGVALALILIMGEGWLVPVLAAGILGGMLSKLDGTRPLFDLLLTPAVATLTLYAMYQTTRRLVSRRLDFRAWQHLVGYIAIAFATCAVSSTILALIVNASQPAHFWADWQPWFIPTALSYVIFTPVMVLVATAERRVLFRNWRQISTSLLLMSLVLALNFLPSRLPLLFAIPMVLPVITLIAGLEGAALSLILTELALTAGAATGHGPSAIAYLSLGTQLYFVQTFLAVLIGVMLPVAAALTERIKLRGSMEQALEREALANTALRISEQHARDLAAEAQAANRAKAEFLAGMSHELRTPLNAILGFTEILKTELYGPLGHPKYGEYAQDVYKSGAHLLDLINDVLDLSKIDAGKMELRESVFSVRELVDDTLQLVRDRARGHVEIRLAIGGACHILADQRLIKQILLNLLSNAIKFTTAGGTITVGTDERAGGGFALSVADTGIGMSEAQIHKAFSHYGQIDSKIARAHQGTGLGLPISRSLARLHGGDLVATSNPGEGTCMTLVLPESRIVRGLPQALFSVG